MLLSYLVCVSMQTAGQDLNALNMRSPYDVGMMHLVHVGYLSGEHPLRLLVQFRLVQNFHSHTLCGKKETDYLNYVELLKLKSNVGLLSFKGKLTKACELRGS